MEKKYIIKDGHIYKRVGIFDEKECLFCGSVRLIRIPSDEVFLSRVGCLQCNKWIEPIKLK